MRIGSRSGFTLLELLASIVIVGILAAVFFPQIRIDQFQRIGGVQQGMAMIRLAQKLAITSGCAVAVSLDQDACILDFATCTPGVPILSPATGERDFCLGSEPGVDPAVNFTFNVRGEPSGGRQLIRFSTSDVTVEAITGFAHE